MKRSLLLFSLVALMLLGCGRAATKRGQEPSRPPDAPTTPTTTAAKTYTLRLFGAPWCTNCKSDFPKINDALRVELTAEKPRVKAELFVTTGDTASQRPTQEIATAYRDFLKLDSTAHVDEWPWKKFREQVQQDRKLPAAVVLDSDNNVIKVFIPGPTTFIAEEIVAFIKGKLQ